MISMLAKHARKATLCILVGFGVVQAEISPFHSASLTFGFGRFFSSKSDQWGNNSGLSGGFEYFARMGIPIGLAADLTYDLCPICDNTGGEFVYSYAAMTELPLYSPNILLHTGLGVAHGKDKTIERNGQQVEILHNDFVSLHIPTHLKILYVLKLGRLRLGTGAEVSFGLNTRNRTFSLQIPLHIGAEP